MSETERLLPSLYSGGPQVPETTKKPDKTLATRPSPYSNTRPSPYRDEAKTEDTKDKKDKKKAIGPTQATTPSPVPGFSAGTSTPEPPPPSDRRAVVVGASVLVAVLAVGAVLVVAKAGGGGGDGETATSDPPLETVATTGPGDRKSVV